MRIALIVLAAGKSSRTGSLGRKPLLPWPNGPGSLLGAVLENYKDAHHWHDAVVVHRDDTPIYQRIVKDAGSLYRSITNSNENAALSDSLRLGLNSISKASEGALVALGDMPFVNQSTIQKILESADPEKIVQPRVFDKPANPVFFPSKFFEALRTSTGDKGGREIIKNNPQHVTTIEFTEPQIFQDIDTPEDYSKAIAQLTQLPKLSSFIPHP
ncbi:MAG: nucleotidyltransferase family protein [Opitutales bacterium]